MNMLFFVIGICCIISLAVIGYLEKYQRRAIIHNALGYLWLVYDNTRIPLYRKTVTLGRRKRRCDIALPETDGGISRVHGRIKFSAGSFYIYPEKKKDGTYTEISVNGMRIHPNGARLDKYSTITISHTELYLEAGELESTPRSFSGYPTLTKILGFLFCSMFIMLLYLKIHPVVPVDNKGWLLAVFFLNIALLSAGFAYSQISKTYLLAFVGSAVMLLAIATAFQSFFPSYLGFLLKLYTGVAIGTLAYFLWPQFQFSKKWHFNVLVLGVIFLLLLNLAFGKEVNGARLWVGMMQPGEVIATLFLPLLGAHCNTKRQKLAYIFCCTISCIVLLLLKDFGTVVVIGTGLILMLYLLYDNRLQSIALIVLAVAALIFLVLQFDYAKNRLGAWGKALVTPGSQQKQIIYASLLGGFTGLMDQYQHFIHIFSANSDAALIGVQALMGWSVLFVALGAFAILAYTTGLNFSFRPSDYMLHSALGILIMVHVALNLCGSLDVLPFSGQVSYWISDGGTSAVSFSLLLGISAAVMNPNNCKKG